VVGCAGGKVRGQAAFAIFGVLEVAKILGPALSRVRHPADQWSRVMMGDSAVGFSVAAVVVEYREVWASDGFGRRSTC
jgi:hypothetical protein